MAVTVESEGVKWSTRAQRVLPLVDGIPRPWPKVFVPTDLSFLAGGDSRFGIKDPGLSESEQKALRDYVLALSTRDNDQLRPVSSPRPFKVSKVADQGHSVLRSGGRPLLVDSALGGLMAIMAQVTMQSGYNGWVIPIVGVRKNAPLKSGFTTPHNDGMISIPGV